MPEEEFEKFKNCDLLLNYSEFVSAEDEYKNVIDNLESYEDNMSDDYRATYKTELTFEKFKEVLSELCDNDLSYYHREDAREDIQTHYDAVKAALGEEIETYRTMGGEEYETFAQHYTTNKVNLCNFLIAHFCFVFSIILRLFHKEGSKIRIIIRIRK